jgi:DNA invertase Pin-like site-specific DNA recombinase
MNDNEVGAVAAPGIPSSGGRLWDRVQAAIKVGVVGFFRQSDRMQARRHVGSQQVQEAQVANVRPFGVDPSQVTILLAWGESGREDVVREKFQELLRLVRARRVGLILLARHDRLGRNTRDAEELFAAMREVGVLIMVDGRNYDPADPSDDFILSIYAKFAEFENRARSRWMMLARFAKARERMLPVPLPSALVWADPEDPEYLAKLESEGMSNWLQRLDQDRTNVTVEERRRRILPFPDARVERCMRLMVEWLLETGSTTAVATRIRDGYEGWPMPGQFPVRLGARYWKPGVQIGWTPVTPAKIYDQLRSPALFGTYQYQAPTLDLEHERRKRERGNRIRTGQRTLNGTGHSVLRVRYPGAFSSYFEPEVEPRIRGILRSSPRRHGEPFQGTAAPIPDAALRVVRCAHVKTNGERCGRAVRPTRTTDGGWMYHAVSCNRWLRPPHRTVVPRELGEHVLDVLREVFSPARLHQVAERVKGDVRSREGRCAEITRRLIEARAKEEGAAALAIEAASKQERAKRENNAAEQTVQARLKERWERTSASAAESVIQLEGELEQARNQEGEFLSASQADLERIVDLGTNLPALIEQARGVPFGLQRIVEALVERVWARDLGSGVAEFSVEFPAGVEVRRLFTTMAPRGTQPQRLFARERLAAGASPEAAGAELAALATEVHVRGWRPAAVRGAAAYSEYFEHVTSREGVHHTAEEIACATAQPADVIRTAGLLGKLGPARWKSDLVYAPTEAELHGALPGYAQISVARAHGFDPDDLVSSIGLRRANRLMTDDEEPRLRRCKAYRDAAGSLWILRREALAQGLRLEVGSEVAERVTASVAEALAALGMEHLDPADFIDVSGLARALGRRFPNLSYGRILGAVRQGRLLSLRAWGMTEVCRCLPDRLYVHAPREVREATRLEVIEDWLGLDPRARHSRTPPP